MVGSKEQMDLLYYFLFFSNTLHVYMCLDHVQSSHFPHLNPSHIYIFFFFFFSFFRAHQVQQVLHIFVSNHWSMGNLPATVLWKKNDSSPSSRQLSTAPKLGVEPSEFPSQPCCNVAWIDPVQVIIAAVSSSAVAMSCAE